MIRLFIDLSRYILIGNALLYCLINLYLLFASPARKHHIALFFQAVFIFLNHITCSFLLMSTRISLDYLIFPLIQMIVLLAFLIILHTIYPTANRMLTNDLIFLLSIGMILLTRLSYAKANRQFLVVCIGLVLICSTVGKKSKPDFPCKVYFCCNWYFAAWHGGNYGR